MNDLNSVLIEGHLTQNPELKTIPTGSNLCRFGIASNRYYRNSEKELMSEVAFVTVDAWGGLAETCNKYLKKGRGVRVVGRLRQERWQDEEENQKERYVIVAEHVEFKPDPNKKVDSGETDSEEQGGSMVFEEPGLPKKNRKK
jgi:single-strand DNA-binding protein